MYQCMYMCTDMINYDNDNLLYALHSGRLRSPRKKSLTSELKIERVSSAEKRKYSQYKCSTGKTIIVLC